MLESNILIKQFCRRHESFFSTAPIAREHRREELRSKLQIKSDRIEESRADGKHPGRLAISSRDKIYTHTRRFVGRTKPVSPQIHTRRFLTEVLTLAPAGELGRSFSVCQREMETEKETRRQEEEKQKEDEARERRTRQGEVKKKEEKRRRRKRRWKNPELVKK